MLLNAVEMQWIADELFIGQQAVDRRPADRRRRPGGFAQHPFAHRRLLLLGDNITPPQQALDWVLDLYDTDDAFEAGGQTIVYTTHRSIGHLGIFVSGKIATKEHEEFVNCMDMIDLLPPGLYEAVITDADAATVNRDLLHSPYLFTLERRTLADLRALGGNDAADDRRFEAVARVSEINNSLYQTFAAPFVRAASTPETAERLRQSHPSRVRFRAFSSQNPAMGAVSYWADWARQDRRPVSPDNPFLAAEQTLSTAITGRARCVRQGPRRRHGGPVPVPLRRAAAAGDGRAERRPEDAAKNGRARPGA